jgi:hypothetical protein
MKIFKRSLIIGFLLAGALTSKAQMFSRIAMQDAAAFLRTTPWTIGLSGHVVDDDGRPFNNLFNAKEAWNLVPYPSRVYIEKGLNNGHSVGADVSYTLYQADKRINGDTNVTANSFFSFNLFGRYDLNNAFGSTGWFNPYATYGLGYTNRSFGANPSVMTINAGLGFNIWILDNFGLNAQSEARFGMASPIFKTGSNYLQHSVGLMYKFGGVSAYYNKSMF